MGAAEACPNWLVERRWRAVRRREQRRSWPEVGTRRCDGECAGGKAEVVKDGADDARGSDVGRHAPVAAALVAGQDVEREGAAKQLGPGKPVMSGRRGWSGRARGLREARRRD
jgi:hypothetical protein